jgi:hypothetical protein
MKSTTSYIVSQILKCLIGKELIPYITGIDSVETVLNLEGNPFLDGIDIKEPFH